MEKLEKYLDKYGNITEHFYNSNIHPTQKAVLTVHICSVCGITVIGLNDGKTTAYLFLAGLTIYTSCLLLLHEYFSKKKNKN